MLRGLGVAMAAVGDGLLEPSVGAGNTSLVTVDFCAWGDESMRRGARGKGSVYLLGAAIIDIDDYDTCRNPLLALPRNGPKLHWHDADAQRRRKIMTAVESCLRSTSSSSRHRQTQPGRSVQGQSVSTNCQGLLEGFAESGGVGHGVSITRALHTEGFGRE